MLVIGFMISAVVHSLVEHLEKIRDAELAERREKRRKQQEEEEAKKKKTEEEEEEKKNDREGMLLSVGNEK